VRPADGGGLYQEVNMDAHTPSPNRSFGPLFDFEKLEVYQLLRKHLCFLVKRCSHLPSGATKTRDHLDRAADSALLNCAEGCGKRRGSLDRRRFLNFASGSAREAASAWDTLHIRGYVSEEASIEARKMLTRVVSMLTKMR
jgi:four helix bundle protein